MLEIGKQAKQASYLGNALSTKEKNDVLEALKTSLLTHQEAILNANAKDIEAAQLANISTALQDRLMLNEERILGMIEGLDGVISLDDPIGVVLEAATLDNGIEMEKVSVPLGVIGIIYESRPNVTIDAFALCFKAGNAVILKGGKEAIHTNTVLEMCVQESLKKCGLSENFIHLIKDTTRQSTMELMKLNKYVDVLIPRGSQALIQTVLRESTIPVIETGAGNCHIYVDASANLDKALAIIENAKCQRPGVCNAVESLVLHESIAQAFIPSLLNHLPNVKMWGDDANRAIDGRILKADEESFYTEFLGPELSIKIVDSIEEAIEHINEYHTSHSDAILTEDMTQADIFTRSVDSAAVYVNASTRFTDGFVFGLGAEIGISTQKLHARGPMGLQALSTYKYILKGQGQIR